MKKLCFVLFPTLLLSLASCTAPASSSSASSSSGSEIPSSSKSEESSSSLAPSSEPSSEQSSEPSEPSSESSSGKEESSSQSLSSSKQERVFTLSSAPYYVPEQIGDDFLPKKQAEFAYGYYAGQPQIIYMDLKIALDFVHESPVEITVEDGITHYACPTGVTYHVDPEQDKLTVTKYDYGSLYSLHYDSPLGLIDSPYAKKAVDTSASKYIPAETDTLLDLGAYNLDIVEDKGHPYVPFFLISELIFTDTYYSPVAFNGDGFYFIDNLSGALSLYHRTNSYSDAYYSGSFSKTSRADYFIRFNFDALMFSLDHFYGFRDERNVPFKSTLETKYPAVLDGLLSKDETAYNLAIERLYEEIIGDGHTNVGDATSPFGGGEYEMAEYRSERTAKMRKDGSELYQARIAKGIQNNVVRCQGNTAILTFPSFMHSYEELTPDNIDELAEGNADTFALLLSAMKQIKAKGGITNVVFDVTINGGGDSNALVAMLGIFNRKFDTCFYNPLSKAHSELHYEIDTNLDGVFDEKDGYQGQFKFFVLTSSYSFSCANMFPFIAKENGIATIIGEQSGGGACVVRFSVTPDGRPIRISGLARTGEKKNPAVHDDAGVPVDHAFPRASFYDDDTIDTFVNTL